MKIKSIAAVCTILLVAFLASANEVKGQGAEPLVSFCQFPMSREIMQANLGFREIISFQVDGDGRPFAIKKILGKYLSEDAVRQCISKWSFAGAESNSRFTVSFSWEHGVGWTRMRITGKNFSQVTLRASAVCQESESVFPNPK